MNRNLHNQERGDGTRSVGVNDIEGIFNSYEEGMEKVVNAIEKFVDEKLKSASYTALRKHYDFYLNEFSKQSGNKDTTYLWKCYIIAKYDEGRKTGGLSKINGKLSAFIREGIKRINKGKLKPEEFKEIYEMLIAISRYYLQDRE